MTEPKLLKPDLASPDNDAKEKRVHLQELINRAAAKDATKDYNAAAELYSEATELQAELNGELSLHNADLLFSYGKALYNVAVSKSDILGSKVAGEPQGPSKNISASGTKPSTIPSGDSNIIKSTIAGESAKSEISTDQTSSSVKAPSKPLFQFSGDENFEDSESEDEQDNEDPDGGDEEEDDFANAFEVLDLARILYHKKLVAEEEQCEKGEFADLPPNLQHITERLADTYDLQAEISLEAERFADAVADLRTALGLRQSLFPMEDPSVAECHYKLSLALEFASVNNETGDSAKGDNDGHIQVDEEMREEAATQMERAIESCRVRMVQEQQKLNSPGELDEDKATGLRRKLANVKEIIEDMEQRLSDLRRPPVSIEQQTDGNDAILKGILGQIVGQSPADQKARLDAVTKDANDLSAFVKRKPGQALSNENTHKRPTSVEAEDVSSTKKARMDRDH